MSRVGALLDVAVVVAVDALAYALLRRLDLGVGVASFGIVPTLLLASWLLYRRGIHWRDLGFRRPESVAKMALWALGLFLVDMLVLPAVNDQLAAMFAFPPQQLNAFAALRGNTPLYLLLLIPVSWGTAAFGEELIYRGFLFGRLSDALGQSILATSAALLAQAALFALGHVYLGPRGILNAGMLALVAGLAFRGCGCNLWPLIIAHGLVDSVGMTALYLGVGHA